MNLRDEACKVAELFAFSAEEKALHIDVNGSGQVLGDRLMIQRAISNLLSNAIRHTPERGIILVRIRSSGPTTTVLVTNPGPGIEASHLPHLFERFYRVDKSRSRSEGGTGLGLAIVHSIMDLHQGSASVYSKAEGPTHFRLDFPPIK